MLITRAKRRLQVFGSLHPSHIDLSRSTKKSIRDFKHFLEFAEKGHVALDRAINIPKNDFESEFEKEVAQGLEDKGWCIHPQVGVSSYRIDLGVVHPNMPGKYLAGIECDGATYHSSATARDKDKLREQVLKGLGCDILRVWPTDWWHDSQCCLEKLAKALRSLLNANQNKNNELKMIATD